MTARAAEIPGEAVGAGRWQRLRRASWAPLLAFAGAAALILAMTWPWCLHWKGEFLLHWDPPFHAWKLEFMARRILAGDIFCSSGGTGNTNMLYPQSGALYFEALQWPPALFAALLFALTRLPSETIYHLSLLVFWALSAPCMYLLLRELACGKAAALAGALVFCILPHRMTYCVEFQMEMVFAIPLVYLFLLRFFRRGSLLDAVGITASWWLLAVSELYEAVFVLMSLPVLALAFLAARPRLLADRRLWTGGIAAGLAGAALVPAMLLPYLTQQGEGTVVRDMQEVLKHNAQPFSYFLPWGRFRPWSLEAFADEFSLYPTLAVLVLAAAGAVLWFRRDWASPPPPAAGSPPPAWRRLLRFVPPLLHAAAPVLWLVFMAVLAIPLVDRTLWTKDLAQRDYVVWKMFLWSLLPLLFVPGRNESPRTTFLRGFTVVAALAWVFSFGPRILVGPRRAHALAGIGNKFYIACYRQWLPFLANFRVVSRFGVLVLLFLVCTAACCLDAVARRRRRAVRLGLAALFVALCAFESLPPPEWVGTYRKIEPMRNGMVVKRLLEKRPPCTLAAVPVTTRNLEGMRMFSLLKDDFPYVYVWGGYFPPFAQGITDAFRKNDRDSWHADLASIYPEVLVLADRPRKMFLMEGFRPFDPAETPEGGPDGGMTLRVDWEKWLAPVAVPVSRDKRFTLFRLKPRPPAPTAVKRFRSDVGRRNPVVEADLAFDGPAAPVSVALNGFAMGEHAPDGDGTVRIRLDLASVPRKVWSKSVPNELAFAAGDVSGDAPAFAVKRFSMVGADGLYHDPGHGGTLDPAAFPSEPGRWD
ncbi:MAG: hypothetical protein IJS32_03440 [Kiritimatiellae bacterium]|nr:hypothetical protein [Kiritimatiellia bacterium]